MGEISMNENDLYKKMIRKKIFELADDEYKKFQENLCPDNDNIVGVRLPLLRDLAREIAKGDWRTYIKTAQDEYYEEIMLQGMVIGCVRTDVEERLRYITNFVPKIDNWGVCDSFCSGLKFTKSNMKKTVFSGIFKDDRKKLIEDVLRLEQEDLCPVPLFCEST